MRVNKSIKLAQASLFLFAMLFLTGFINGADVEADRSKLLEQEKELTIRIETLKREQDYLRFQKEMQALDSKYLLLDLNSKIGQLRYRNRILKHFNFTSTMLAQIRKEGMVSLTRKIEGAKKRHALLFGTALIVHGKQPPPVRLKSGIPRISVSQKDIIALFYALEQGSPAYILR